MKTFFTSRFFLAIALCAISLPFAMGQCTDKVSHITGSALVSGVNVTVTSVGNTCSWTSYCFGITDPYFIGYNPGPGSGPGAFTFTFSPPINGVRMNFSGASCSGASCEEIRLAINGAHYPMASVGVNNACDPMAVLTGAGDLQGCANCGVSGWSNTNITGFPISTLTVEDFVLGGVPNGSLFSLWICPGVLPTEWINFEAVLQEDNTVALDWSTQTEINNDFFTVERSLDGLRWEAIGEVDAAGNSDSRRDYGYVDQQPSTGENHYRIRQTSLNGAFSHSEVRTVVLDAAQGIHISPNPARTFVNIEMAGLDLAVITLRNQLGQEVRVPRELSGDRLTLRTAELARGVYYLEVRTGMRVHAQKLIVE